MIAGDRRRDGSRGLGLGLFITQRIVEAHGGSVDVVSTESTGTTFTVTLPRLAKPASVGISAARSLAPRARKETPAAGDRPVARERRPVPLAGRGGQGLRDLHARSPGPRGHLERRREAHQGLRGQRDHRPALLAFLRRGAGAATGPAIASWRSPCARSASRTKAGACARTARSSGPNVVITRAARQEWRAGRIHQGHARPDRAPAPAGRATARRPRPRRRSACATSSCRWSRTS